MKYLLETSPSGNMHGMPLATAIAEDNEESKVHELDEKTTKQWNMLKTIGKINQKVLPEDIVFISLRDFEKEEKFLIEKYGMKVLRFSNAAVDRDFSKVCEAIHGTIQERLRQK